MKQANYILLFAAAVCGLLVWLTREIPYCGWDFHNSLWGPTNLLIQHQTPYTFNAPYGPYPGVWMPTLIGALFFFGYLPCDIPAKVWLFAELAGFLWGIWMIAGYKLPSPWKLFVCILALAMFPPIWFHIQLGQFSMLFVVFMMVIVYIPKSERFWPFLLVLGMSKPQLTILVYPGLLLSIWHKYGFLRAGKLVLITGLCALILLIPVFWFYPAWVKDFFFITFGNFKVAWDLPTIFVQLPYLIGKSGYVIWGVLALATMVVSLWCWVKKEPQKALLVSLAGTPMVTTYASSWDFLLLMPAFFWLTIHLKEKAARFVLFASMAILFVIQISLRWQRDYPDGRQWWIPLALNMVFLVSLAIESFMSKKKNLQVEQVAAI